jgi:hypothetical protein
VSISLAGGVFRRVFFLAEVARVLDLVGVYLCVVVERPSAVALSHDLDGAPQPRRRPSACVYPTLPALPAGLPSFVSRGTESVK